MKYSTALIVILVILSAPLSEVYAGHNVMPVTPYGDFCPLCTKYGICKSAMTHEDAKKAMLDYYHKKGFNIELEKKRGRFIKVKVKEKDKVVDVIIFDRMTGRMRSIF